MLSQLFITGFRLFHVAVSVAALIAGVVYTRYLVKGRLSRGVSISFLTLTLLTSATALVIHPFATGPAHTGGFLSILFLMVAAIPLLARKPSILLQCLHFTCSMLAFYINALAAVVTAFQFEPHLRRLTPTLAHPPLSASQLVAAAGVPAFSVSLDITTMLALALLVWSVYRNAFVTTDE